MDNNERIDRLDSSGSGCVMGPPVKLHGGATPADLARERGKPDVAVVLNDLPSRDRAERLLRAEPSEA